MSTEARQAGVGALDLDAYLARVGYDGRLEPTAATLHALHLAHATSIPFENLDVLAGVPIRLDPDGLQAKLVRGRRGGYCFEQNALLALVLERLGFAVTRLAARVRFAAHHVLPRTHMALAVEADGERWLTDVGFGGWGLLHPLPLRAGEFAPLGWPYRLGREGEGGPWVLSALTPDGWQDLYAFTLEPQLPVDYEPANYYVSHHPDSIFRRTLLVQLPGAEARHLLRDRDLVTVRPGRAAEAVRLDPPVALRAALVERFGIDVPPRLVLPPGAA